VRTSRWVRRDLGSLALGLALSLTSRSIKEVQIAIRITDVEMVLTVDEKIVVTTPFTKSAPPGSGAWIAFSYDARLFTCTLTIEDRLGLGLLAATAFMLLRVEFFVPNQPGYKHGDEAERGECGRVAGGWQEHQRDCRGQELRCGPVARSEPHEGRTVGEIQRCASVQGRHRKPA
jgi:hypothetical protein